MADSLRIDTGVKRVLINDGPEFIEFVPGDVNFVEKFYSVVSEFKQKADESKERGLALDSKTEVDSDGLPLNMAERIGFARELCEYAYEKIDYLFGEGTSKKVFGGVYNLELVEQFFAGLLPFVQDARETRLKKYRPNQKSVLKELTNQSAARNG